MKQATAKPAFAPARKSRGGRPAQGEAEKLDARILDAARDLFFNHGYGAASIEMLAGKARISKRTFYARYKDKAAIFRAVVHRVIEQLRPADTAALFEGADFHATLEKVASLMLRAALTPHVLALHRLLLAEAGRFPELAPAMAREGARAEAITRIAALLKREAKAKGKTLPEAEHKAEQFMILVIAAPQRRALTHGKPMTEKEMTGWAKSAVALFLNGCWGKTER